MQQVVPRNPALRFGVLAIDKDSHFSKPPSCVREQVVLNGVMVSPAIVSVKRVTYFNLDEKH